MNPAYNPFLLSGLLNFYHEIKMDRCSFLNEYYKKNKHLLTDEEDDDEIVDDIKSDKIKRVLRNMINLTFLAILWSRKIHNFFRGIQKIR